MLLSGKCYQPEMSGVAELLKAKEERCKSMRRRKDQEKEEERRRYEEEQ